MFYDLLDRVLVLILVNINQRKHGMYLKLIE